MRSVLVQVTKLKVSINETIASGTRAVNEIYERHERLNDHPDKREELMRQTEQAFDVAAEVLKDCDICSTHLHEHSDDLPKWVDCFKTFIHYRCVVSSVTDVCCFSLLSEHKAACV